VKARLGFLLPSFGTGGTERATLNLAKGLLERGYAVDLVVLTARGGLVSSVPEGARVVELGISRSRFALLKLVRYLRDTSAEVLICAQSHINLLGIIARDIARVKLPVVVREVNHLGSVIQHPAGALERFYPLLLRVLYPRAAAILAVSQGVSRDLMAHLSLPEDRIQVCYNPIDLELIQERKTAEPEIPWPGDPSTPRLLSVGRLVPQKDHATLIRAFTRLLGTRPARLMILGEGPLRAGLEKQIRDLGVQGLVSLPGEVDNAFPYMAGADVFVLPSAWEGLGNVLLEALACGTTVVATDCPSGPAEILQDGRFGRLVPVGSAEGMAQAILASMETPHSAETLHRRAEDFAMDRVMDRYLNVLGTCCGIS
jgi:glycosyltransferase involved in cell wall biosynthesis